MPISVGEESRDSVPQGRKRPVVALLKRGM